MQVKSKFDKVFSVKFRVSQQPEAGQTAARLACGSLEQTYRLTEITESFQSFSLLTKCTLKRVIHPLQLHGFLLILSPLNIIHILLGRSAPATISEHAFNPTGQVGGWGGRDTHFALQRCKVNQSGMLWMRLINSSMHDVPTE